MTRWHKTLPERFGSFPKHQTILMVANELNRANNLLTNPGEYRNCLERALELLDLFSTDKRWRSALRELRRAREVIARIYSTSAPVELNKLVRALIQLEPAAWNMTHPGR
jgi:hypothetical protein